MAFTALADWERKLIKVSYIDNFDGYLHLNAPQITNRKSVF